MSDREWVGSGTPWEALAGYARAVRVGDTIYVSGTTASSPDGVAGGNDPAAQAQFAINKIDTALQSLGSSLKDVVRTRVYVSDIANWEPVARVHGERFGAIRPANTLVESRLVSGELLVEIEAEARIGSGK